jgi:hypothetical protein
VRAHAFDQKTWKAQTGGCYESTELEIVVPRRSWGEFFLWINRKRSRGGGKSENPDALRDFQVEWESPAFGLFHGTAFSTALVPKDCATEP